MWNGQVMAEEVGRRVKLCGMGRRGWSFEERVELHRLQEVVVTMNQSPYTGCSVSKRDMVMW